MRLVPEVGLFGERGGTEPVRVRGAEVIATTIALLVCWIGWWIWERRLRKAQAKIVALEIELGWANKDARYWQRLAVLPDDQVMNRRPRSASAYGADSPRLD